MSDIKIIVGYIIATLSVLISLERTRLQGARLATYRLQSARTCSCASNRGAGNDYLHYTVCCNPETFKRTRDMRNQYVYLIVLVLPDRHRM